MNKEEAIAFGEEQLEIFGSGCYMWEFINMAIQALSQEPMREFTKEEAKAYSKSLDKMYKPTGFNVFDEPCDDAEQIDYHDDFATALKKINDYEMTRDERAAISILNAYKVGYESGMEDYKQEPCTDAVSREEVKKIVDFYTEQYDGIFHVNESIDKLPSVTQKSVIEDIKADLINEANEHMTEGNYNDGVRFGLMLAEQIVLRHRGKEQKPGKWIYRAEDKYSCSKCGTTTRVDESGIDEKPMYKFCPYCGAKMESEVNNG